MTPERLSTKIIRALAEFWNPVERIFVTPKLTPERLEEIRTYVDTPIVLELLAEVDRLKKVVDAACSYVRSGGSTLAAKDIMAAVKDYQQSTDSHD